jgi:hypothetical protein
MRRTTRQLTRKVARRTRVGAGGAIRDFENIMATRGYWDEKRWVRKQRRPNVWTNFRGSRYLPGRVTTRVLRSPSSRQIFVKRLARPKSVLKKRNRRFTVRVWRLIFQAHCITGQCRPYVSQLDSITSWLYSHSSRESNPWGLSHHGDVSYSRSGGDPALTPSTTNNRRHTNSALPQRRAACRS